MISYLISLFYILNEGGEMIELMRLTGGFHTVDDMVQACSQPGGMNKNLIARMNEKLKGTAVPLCTVLHFILKNHLSHTNQIRKVQCQISIKLLFYTIFYSVSYISLPLTT